MSDAMGISIVPGEVGLADLRRVAREAVSVSLDDGAWRRISSS